MVLVIVQAPMLPLLLIIPYCNKGAVRITTCSPATKVLATLPTKSHDPSSTAALNCPKP